MTVEIGGMCGMLTVNAEALVIMNEPEFDKVAVIL
jgi:hypothetical protein